MRIAEPELGVYGYSLVQTIVQHAEQGNFDVLVVGRQGHPARWLTRFGSTSGQIAFYAPCTVMVVA